MENTAEYIVNTTEDNFEETVIQASQKQLVLCDISADWCAPCNILKPVLTQVAHEYKGQFILSMVDADENMKIAGRHKVRGFPTVIAYAKGEEIGRFQSAQSKSFLMAFVEDHLF